MRRRTTWWLVGVPLAVLGLLMGPVLMDPLYRAMAPTLGPSTLLIVELIFAFLIDLPVAGLFVAIVTSLGQPPRNPARAALGFVFAFFAAILVCIVLSPLHPFFAWLGLAETFRPAVAGAVGAFGMPTVGVMLACYLAFDLLVCAGAGIAGHALARRKERG